MPPPTTEHPPREREPSLDVELWLDHDHDPAVRRPPGTAPGPRTLRRPAAEEVAELHRAGVRRLRLADPVPLCRDAPAAALHALLLVREATARGLAVRWSAHCADGCVADGRFHHLQPPIRVTGRPPADQAGRWRAGYFPGKCVYRRGPGFVEVRDRRFGAPALLTIEEPGHLDRIDALDGGTPAAHLPARVRRDFTEAGLITEQAGLAWWLPTRARRDPSPAVAR
ncbi:DUF5825 family protein [Kitasatospora phosalacinea]|uniref:DUF5825 family protein n=1 Tax=Kitasatospora phosalacinea TaxID=2065 RepID=A0ABW6GKX4_9ACTN